MLLLTVVLSIQKKKDDIWMSTSVSITVYLGEVCFDYSKACFIKISSHTEISAAKAALTF